MTKSGIIGMLAFLMLVGSCQNGNELEEKKGELKMRKEQLVELNNQIKILEQEISELDPDFSNESDNLTLVSTFSIPRRAFVHKIEVRGAVESRKNITLSSEIMGRILQINVTEGSTIEKGQSLMSIEAEMLRNTIKELETSLELAEAIYVRQANLWGKGIGSEIQYLQAKNNKETLDRKLATSYSELQKASVRAPFSGSIDEVFVRQGEMVLAGSPLFRIVSLKNMYIKADVSESYIGKFKKGDQVNVSFPSLDHEFTASINAVGQVINDRNRTFAIEVNLPAGEDLYKPNLTALVELKDYENENAMVVPSELIQKDSQGDYVFLLNTSTNAPTVNKVHITRGISYEGETEILGGLTEDQQLINKGFRDVTDGVSVRLAKVDS